jgi:neurofibromin 1
MKLLGFCVMDQGRLVQLFQELSSLLVSMKREAQSSIALSLRNAIWNWISGFPDQFSEVIKSNSFAEVVSGGSRGLLGSLIGGGGGARRLEGAPERVFDTLYGMMQDPGSLSTNRRIIWPTLAALLAVSPERLRQSEMALGGGHPANKKASSWSIHCYT